MKVGNTNKLIKVAQIIDYKANTNDLMNYEDQSPNSINNRSFQTTSSPKSFPKIMENAILIKNESMNLQNLLKKQISVTNNIKQHAVIKHCTDITIFDRNRI